MASGKVFGKLFISAGAMKAGTTWLYDLLLRHPELHFTLEKELHYFYDRDVWARSRDVLRLPRQLSKAHRMRKVRERYLNRIDPDHDSPDEIRAKRDWIASYLKHPVDDAWYWNLFAQRAEGAWACDFSNLYARLSARNWRRIAAQSEDLKVLYTMRDPLERMWSHVKFYQEQTGQAATAESWTPAQYRRFFADPWVRVHTDYGRVVRNLRAGLGDGALKLMFYEEIHADRRAALRQVETFLGVAPFDYPEGLLERRMAQSRVRPMPAFLPELFGRQVARIVKDLQGEGVEVPAGWGIGRG